MKLEEHPFFKEVKPDKISVLAKAAQVEEFASNRVIFEERSPSDNLCLVLEGIVAFSKKIPDGNYRTVSYSHAGQFFGEVGLFTGQPRSLRAEAKSRVVIAKIPGVALVGYIQNTPGPIGNILESIINHLHETTRHYVEDMLQQEKLAVVGSMMNTIIHDFKNPFCLINLGSQLIKRDHRDEKTQKICNNIEEQIQRMVEMAEEVNMFSKGRHALRLKKVNLKSLLERFKELNFPFFERENIEIKTSVPDIDLEAEPNKILRILQNLVGNAIEAFEGESGIISISAEVDEKDVTLAIKDNACGIPPQIRHHLFDPFVTYGKGKGTGLGTAIVKSIVEAHKGHIRFETETGKGTSFFIRLPLRQSEA